MSKLCGFKITQSFWRLLAKVRRLLKQFLLFYRISFTWFFFIRIFFIRTIICIFITSIRFVILLIILFIFVSLLFALVFPNAVLAIQNTLLFIMPGLLYSGLSWPDEWMGRLPSLLQIFFPITYLAVPLRDLSLMGSSGLLMHNVGNMLGTAGALFLVDFLLLVKKHRGESCL